MSLDRGILLACGLIFRSVEPYWTPRLNSATCHLMCAIVNTEALNMVFGKMGILRLLSV